jgi:hypothetical protein
MIIKRTILLGWGLWIILAVVLWSALDFPPQYDEVSHQTFSRYIAAHPTWETLRTYKGAEEGEAKGPFFFILAAIFGTLFGFDLAVLRILVILFSLTGTVIFLKLMGLFNQDSLAWRAGSIVLLPYYLILSVTFMTDLPTLALLLISAYGYISNMNKTSWQTLILAAVAATGMVYTRIDNCYLLIGIFLSYWWHGGRNWRFLVALFAPLALRFPLVIIWGGLAAPPSQLRPNPVAIGFYLPHLIFVLSVLGFYFWPLILTRVRLNRPNQFIIALGGIVVALFFLPQFTGVADVDKYGGALRSFLFALRNPIWIKAIELLTIFIGILGCLQLFLPNVSREPSVLAIQLSCIIGLLMQTLRGEVIYERYLIQVFVLVLLLFCLFNKNKLAFICWCGWMGILQVLHLKMHNIL